MLYARPWIIKRRQNPWKMWSCLIMLPYSSSQLWQIRRHMTRIAADRAISVMLHVRVHTEELSSVWFKTNKCAWCLDIVRLTESSKSLLFSEAIITSLYTWPSYPSNSASALLSLQCFSSRLMEMKAKQF
jgi:hypothetical protein